MSRARREGSNIGAAVHANKTPTTATAMIAADVVRYPCASLRRLPSCTPSRSSSARVVPGSAPGLRDVGVVLGLRRVSASLAAAASLAACSSTRSGKTFRKDAFFTLNAMDAAASRRFSAREVVTLPVVPVDS